MTYREALEFIHGISWRGSRPGLSRTVELTARLGNPQDDLKFIHVAGTNGKGSTSAMLESIFRAAGYRTGLYTSPYLYRFNERIQVCGTPIADMELARLVECIRPHAGAMADPPTEFELITALGLLYFKQSGCDIVILETGLGGELDSTNIIAPPEAAVITTINYDHMNILGTGITQIARAKAGIIKDGCVTVTCTQMPEAAKVIRETAASYGSRLYIVPDGSVTVTSYNLERQVFDYNDADGGRISNITLPLLGSYQPHNAALAIKTAMVLDRAGRRTDEAAIRKGLSEVSWKGRFDIIYKNPTVILDGAHNAQGVSAVTESLKRYFPQKKIIFILSVLSDKDADSMIGSIAGIALCIIALETKGPRGRGAKELFERIRGRVPEIPAKMASCAKEACLMASDMAGDGGIICALGSFTRIGEIKSEFDAIFAGRQPVSNVPPAGEGTVALS